METIRINGMSCNHCVSSVTKTLEEITGITDVQVNLDKGEARYSGEVDQKVIKDAITKIGFEVV